MKIIISIFAYLIVLGLGVFLFVGSLELENDINYVQDEGGYIHEGVQDPKPAGHEQVHNVDLISMEIVITEEGQLWACNAYNRNRIRPLPEDYCKVLKEALK